MLLAVYVETSQAENITELFAAMVVRVFSSGVFEEDLCTRV